VAGYECDPTDFDTCYKGDLAGKFGKLKMDDNEVTVYDTSLTFAEVQDLSFVLHAKDGSRMGCSDVKDVLFVSISDSKVEGKLVFLNMGPAGVKITTQFTAKGGSTSSTEHAWHLHADKVSDLSMCATAGGHYDPKGVEVDGYTCDPLVPMECYKGDLAGKFGKVKLDGVATEVFDSSLDFAELVDLSVVIHDTDKSRMGCGNFAHMVDVMDPEDIISAGPHLEAATLAAVVAMALAGVF